MRGVGGGRRNGGQCNIQAKKMGDEIVIVCKAFGCSNSRQAVIAIQPLGGLLEEFEELVFQCI